MKYRIRDTLKEIYGLESKGSVTYHEIRRIFS